MYLVSKCREESDLSLCMTLGLYQENAVLLWLLLTNFWAKHVFKSDLCRVKITFELLPNCRNNWFVVPKTKLMKYFINWISLRIHVHSIQFQPSLNCPTRFISFFLLCIVAVPFLVVKFWTIYFTGTWHKYIWSYRIEGSGTTVVVYYPTWLCPSFSTNHSWVVKDFSDPWDPSPRNLTTTQDPDQWGRAKFRPQAAPTWSRRAFKLPLVVKGMWVRLKRKRRGSA